MMKPADPQGHRFEKPLFSRNALEADISIVRFEKD
jgi:hypothetical protein